jgi:hypothetical protein
MFGCGQVRRWCSFCSRDVWCPRIVPCVRFICQICYHRSGTECQTPQAPSFSCYIWWDLSWLYCDASITHDIPTSWKQRRYLLIVSFIMYYSFFEIRLSTCRSLQLGIRLWGRNIRLPQN